MMRCVALLALSGVATAIPTLRQLQAGGPDKCDEDASFQGRYAFPSRRGAQPQGTPLRAAQGGTLRRVRELPPRSHRRRRCFYRRRSRCCCRRCCRRCSRMCCRSRCCVCTMWKACHVADRAPLRGGQPGRRSSTRRAAPTRPARAMAACRPRATPSVPTCSRHTSGTARPSCRRPT